MEPPKAEILQGTLDLMVLKTLDVLGPIHGYAIARRIEQVSDHLLQLNQGTLYPALLRLERQGMVRTKWGLTDTNRRARFYSLTAAGRRRLRSETENWDRVARVIVRLLGESA
ncbi:MAG TPA: PadR family transcriptional regulator [Vicinamibacterales bacterium]|nr:PadR family transcriptional regulator [Vicinamibacterales bacterium]